MYGAAVKFV